MTDEAAFLAALKANPTDDTTRLVYADWLDDHNEPQKAEYLRLITRLPENGNDIDLTSAEVIRANQLGQGFQATWSEVVAGRFDLVLLRFRDKVKAIIRVRELFGVGLASAKSIVEDCPILLNQATIEVATGHHTRLADYQTRLADNFGMELVIRRSGRIELPSVVFDVVANFSRYSAPSGHSDRHAYDPVRDTEAHDALARVASIGSGINLEEARQQALTPPLILAQKLSLWAAQRLVEQCRPYLTNAERYATTCRIEGRVRSTS